jgi:hypothetical protein
LPVLGGDPGEHSDWVGCMRRFNAELRPGGCIVAGTDQGVYATYKPHASRLIFRSMTADGSCSTLDVAMEESVLREKAADGGARLLPPQTRRLSGGGPCATPAPLVAMILRSATDWARLLVLRLRGGPAGHDGLRRQRHRDH